MNLTLFDVGEPPARTPQQAADAAIAAVRESAPVDWYAAAAKAVRDVARRQACLTTDDAQELLTSLGISEPPEPRAWADYAGRGESRCDPQDERS